MTCRHGANDPNCSSYRTPSEREEDLQRELASIRKQYNLQSSLDKQKYEVIDAVPVGDLLVLQVKYESCPDCTYEGEKVMVVRATMLDALRWKKIDPHFRTGPFSPSEAPSPMARFPATEDGLEDAINYAKSKELK